METLDNFRKIFLIRFTEELIRNSEKIEIRKLQGIINLKEKDKFAYRREEIKPKREIKPEREFPPKKIILRPAKKIARVREIAKPSLFIPEPKLPEHLKYLRPVPTAGIEIDLWKLNPLVKDRAVRIIEVNPDEKVIVTGAMGTKPTGIILNKEDIDKVINEFSKVSKIPVEEGIYRVAVGNLVLSAIVSEVIGSKFMIKKIIAPPKPRMIQARPQTPSLQMQKENPKLMPRNQNPFLQPK